MKLLVVLDEKNKVINLFNKSDDYVPAAKNEKEIEEKLFFDLVEAIMIPESDVFLEGNVIKVVRKEKRNTPAFKYLASYFDTSNFRAITGIKKIESSEDYQKNYFIEISEDVYNYLGKHILECNGNAVKVSKDLFFVDKVEELDVQNLKLTPEDRFEMEKHLIVEKKSGMLFSRLDDRVLHNFFDFTVKNNELLSLGVVITDENRDEQYLKILRDAASDDESVKSAAEKKIDVLSDYLEAYDSLSEHFSVHKKFRKFRKEILDCANYEEIEKVIKEYEEKHFSIRR